MTFMNTLKENAEVAGAMLLVQGKLKEFDIAFKTAIRVSLLSL